MSDTPVTTTHSASAQNVAICRAIAAHEPQAEMRGPDYLAEIFLGPEARASLKNPATFSLIKQRVQSFSPDSYEYFIARTAYFDALTAAALRDDMPQIVVLGAGYDTRAYRFADHISHTRIFEVDSAPTQQRKRELLAQAQVGIAAALTYVTVDFTSDDLVAALAQAGCEPGQRTLFIWEGVTYYLPPEAVDSVLDAVQRHAAPDSIISFDYMLPAGELAGRYGAQQARDAMKALYTDEPLQFDLSSSVAAAFLSERGFEVTEHLLSEDLQRRYLTLLDGSSAGQVLGLFGIVQARVVG